MDALIELYFQQKFYPAEDWKDSTIQLTTQEIYDAICLHTGVKKASGNFMEVLFGGGSKNEFKESDVYEWMSENGYHFDSIDGVKMVWLMIER